MATAVLTFTAPVATRIAAALGKSLGLVDGAGTPRASTMPEYEDWLRDVTRRMVQGQESADAHAALAPPAVVVIT